MDKIEFNENILSFLIDDDYDFLWDILSDEGYSEDRLENMTWNDFDGIAQERYGDYVYVDEDTRDYDIYDQKEYNDLYFKYKGQLYGICYRKTPWDRNVIGVPYPAESYVKATIQTKYRRKDVSDELSGSLELPIQ